MTAARLALAAALLAGVAGCSTWNPLVAMGIQSEPAHKPTPLAPITATVTPRAVWKASVGKSGAFELRPAADGGRVYAAEADGAVTVLDEETGKVVTRTETKRKISGGVAVAGDKVLVGTLKGEVVALDAASGKQAWSTSVAGEVIAPASSAMGVAVVRTADGRIFGLALADGKRQWVYQRPTPSLLLRSSAGTIAIERNVVAGYPNGKLIGLDIEDGELTWEVTVTQPQGATELERIADVAGLPVIDGNKICAAAFQGKVGCFEVQSRNLLWSRELSTARDLGLDARHIYVVDATGAVHALDKGTGASVWKQDKLQYRKLTSPALVDGRVVVGDGFGFLHVLSPEDGSIVGRLATDGSAVLPLVPAAGGVLAQTAGGSLSLVKF